MPAVMVTGHTATQNSPFLPQWWPKPFTCTQCTYPRRYDQAELTLAGWYTCQRSSPSPVLARLDIA